MTDFCVCGGELIADKGKVLEGYKHLSCVACKKGYMKIEKYINDSICNNASKTHATMLEEF